MVDAPADDSPLEDRTVLEAISVFGARLRGVTVQADTPGLADELQRRWDAEGHAPPPRFAPDSVPGRVLRLARTGAARLPDTWQARLRRGVELARRRRRS